MKNLAGVGDCDREIRRELERARIPAVEGYRAGGEVPFTVTGRLGIYTFWRAWYYWVAGGPVPLDVARELYADPVGKTDVRVGGHCGCPSPDEYGADYFDADGLLLCEDPTGSEREAAARYVEKGFIPAEKVAEWRFVADKRADAVRAHVDNYHIDTDVGLRLFADTLRRHGLCGEPIKEREG